MVSGLKLYEWVSKFARRLAIRPGKEGIMQIPNNEVIRDLSNEILTKFMKHNVPQATIKSEKDVKIIYNQIIARERRSAEALAKQKKPTVESLLKGEKHTDERGRTWDFGTKDRPFQGFTPKVVPKVTVDEHITFIKSKEPIESMKEANKVIKREGRYKNLTNEESQKILKDTDDHIFERDIKPDEFDPDYASGGRVPLAGGKGVMSVIKMLLKKKPKSNKLSEQDVAALKKKHGLDPESLKKDEEAFNLRLQQILAKHSTKHAEGGRIGMMYGGDPGFAFEYGGSWADWHDQHRNTMPVEQYIQTKLPKARLPFREMQTGGLAYMLGEPTYMKYGVGGSVGHAPWHKPTGHAQPTPHMDTPTPNVATRPDPLKAPRGLPSLAPKNMDPAYMQQQMMQKAMMGRGQGNMAQGPRTMANEGGRIGFGDGTPKIPKQFLEDLKKRDYHEFLEKYRRWKENYERRKDLGVTQEAAEGGIMRMGFKKGGDMSRRGFLKLVAGLAALPVVGKFFKLAKPAAAVTETIITSNAKGMPAWFPSLVKRVLKEGKDETAKLGTLERQTVHTTKLPTSGTEIQVTRDLVTEDIIVDIGMGKHGWPAGRHGQPTQLILKKGEWIEPTKGKKGVKTKDEFTVDEAEFTGGHPENVKFEESVQFKYGDHGSDFGEVERYATGKKNIDKKIVGKQRDADNMAEERAIQQAEDVDDFAKGGLAYLLGE